MNSGLIKMENIVKTYNKVQALQGVTVTVSEREILGLVGDNGAGKSTLASILSGAIKPDFGNIYFKGKHVNIKNTRDAINLGIETIYQDSALVSQLSISRNLFLGREPVHKWSTFINVLDKGYIKNETKKLLKQVGIKKDIDPDTAIDNLSGGERQSIAIARAVFFKADLIILDEPTNNLGVEESRQVLKFIQEAKEAGHSSIFITHNIHHVFQVVDRIVVLRHGKLVGDVRRDETTQEEIEKVITGIINTKISNVPQ
ncbi:MAG: ATP-binding cassette domain-containing protein [Candidatus Humimicrobiaceae bacterium]